MEFLKKNLLYISVILIVIITLIYKNISPKNVIASFDRDYNNESLYDKVSIINSMVSPYGFISNNSNKIISYHQNDSTYTIETFDLKNMIKEDPYSFNLLNNEYPNIINGLNKEKIYFLNKGDHYSYNTSSFTIEKAFYANNFKIFRFYFVNNSEVLFFGEYKKGDSISTGLFLKKEDSIINLHTEYKADLFNKNLEIFYDGLFKESSEYYSYAFYHLSKILLISKKDLSITTINTKENITQEIPSQEYPFYTNNTLTNKNNFIKEEILYNISFILDLNNKNGLVLDKYSLKENNYIGSIFIESDYIINNTHIGSIDFYNNNLFITTLNGEILLYENINF